MTEQNIREIQQIKIHGRVGTNTDRLTLFWTASGFECNITGTEFWIEVEVSYHTFEPWFSYTINGDWIARQALPCGRYWIPLFRNMNPNLVKNVRFFKDSQAMHVDGDCLIQIHSIRYDGEFSNVQDSPMKIEFIGDSITSGEGLFGATTEWDWIPMFFSSLRDYSYLTSKLLNAEYRVFSQSGWGVYHSWDNNPKASIPQYYQQICGVMNCGKAVSEGSTSAHDFSSWVPDYIVVNLGTNDEAAFHQPAWIDEQGISHQFHMNEDGTYNANDISKFEHAVSDFLQQLRICNPNAQIIWCYGMIGYSFENPILRGIEFYQTQSEDCNIHYLRLPSVTDKTYGSREHPGYLCHQQAAKVLAEYIKSL